MKFLETHFEEYINSVQKNNLHDELNIIFDRLPLNIEKMPNLIFYGPSGIGKYSQMLNAIKKYSQTNLKYDKKMTVVYDKKQYFYRISDIHYEIDVSLLGCNSKTLWNEIYNQIVDVISTKSNKTGIIVCKDFHNIYSELLDIFYSYIQENVHTNINIKFILLTEQISFIPNEILNCFQLINISRPNIFKYEECITLKTNDEIKNVMLDELEDEKKSNVIVNIKDYQIGNFMLICPHKIICDKIYYEIINVNQLKFLKFRDLLYDILIYNLDIFECVWYILHNMIINNNIKCNKMSDVMIKTFIFFKYYNNNYRPIYHLENYLFYLIKIVNEY